MKGKPKYNFGDKVSFSVGEETYNGTIYIIDSYGTWEDPSDVSYDIMVEVPKFVTEHNPKGECLYKHIREDYVSSYIG